MISDNIFHFTFLAPRSCVFFFINLLVWRQGVKQVAIWLLEKLLIKKNPSVAQLYLHLSSSQKIITLLHETEAVVSTGNHVRLRVQFGINCTSGFIKKYQNCTRPYAKLFEKLTSAINSKLSKKFDDYLSIINMQNLPRKAQCTRRFPRSRSRADFIYSDWMFFKCIPQLQILDKISRHFLL